LATDDEVDVEVPESDVEKEILSIIDADKKSGKKVGYVFDQFTHKEVDKFLEFLQELGPPDFLIHTAAEQ